MKDPLSKHCHHSVPQVQLQRLGRQPLVSIVVPSYNQGRFIGETIRSILEQDYRPLKIHVVDGGSQDETVDVLNSFRGAAELSWISEPDRGVVDAVNKGFAQVEGRIVGIQSSDDVYLPGTLSKMVRAFQQRPRHGLLYADIETVDVDGQPLSRSDIEPFSVRAFLSKQTWIPQPAAFFRREMLDALGGWDERYFSADTELWMRMVFRTEVEKLDQVIAQRRQHDGQRNHQAATIAEAYRSMVRDSVDIAEASSELQRAAKAGTFLHAIRYNASGSQWRASVLLWRALFADPSLWRKYSRSPLLIPGWIPARVLLSRAKQAFLSTPVVSRS